MGNSNGDTLMQGEVRWGILSSARIAQKSVIPGIQSSSNGIVAAIASRDLRLAKEIAELLNIEKAYGSYEELLSDPEIDAVYIPLPNHLHVQWAIRALRAGKHVLCEKPIGMSATDASTLLAELEKHPQLIVMEAFMYRFHPQWLQVKSFVQEGVVGEVKTIQSFFSYFNIDSKNIRNRIDLAGGALMDIGCYCTAFPRFLFDEEPLRVVSHIDRDPHMKTDRMTSAMMAFSGGKTSTFTCSTQLMPYQRVHVFGTNGYIEIEIPVNAPKEGTSKIWVRTPNRLQEIVVEAVDQYAIQVERFAASILGGSKAPVALADAIHNMKVIDALFESEKKNEWVAVL